VSHDRRCVYDLYGVRQLHCLYSMPPTYVGRKCSLWRYVVEWSHRCYLLPFSVDAFGDLAVMRSDGRVVRINFQPMWTWRRDRNQQGHITTCLYCDGCTSISPSGLVSFYGWVACHFVSCTRDNLASRHAPLPDNVVYHRIMRTVVSVSKGQHYRE